jgi:hypothetical protein
MAQGARQHEILDTLKLINAASTAFRLYPEDSVQVVNATENAYLGVKTFLRSHEILRFSYLKDGYYLNGEAVDNPTRERLQLLTFSDQLRKMELNELVLAKGFDRIVFKKVLSVFGATPEEIHRAGGHRAFIEQLQLTEIFPVEYFAPGESAEEQKLKKRVDGVLEKLSGGLVRPEYILFLVGRKKGDLLQKTLQESFLSPEKGGHIVATTIYSLFQILSKEHIVVVAPAFSAMLEQVSGLLTADIHEKVASRSASFLAPYLDQRTVLMLICQEYPSSFGGHFQNALFTLFDNATLTSVLHWIQAQRKKSKATTPEQLSQIQVLIDGYDRVVSTPHGKQVLALESTKAVLQQTEQGRKEKRLQAGITALAKGDLAGLKSKEVCLSIPATVEKLLHNDKESIAAAIIKNIVRGLQDKNHEDRVHYAQVIGGVASKLAYLQRWGWLEKLTPVCLGWIRETETADLSFKNHVLAMHAMMNQAWAMGNISLAEQILDVFYYIRSGALGKSDPVRKLIGRIQDKNVDLALLQGYLDRCFVKPVDEQICHKIIMQGPVAARFLLDTLITSEKRSHRIRLLKVLSGMGGALVPVLLERLPDPMPWYGKRNIIRLLAETGTENDVQGVLEYASHEDLRVQQETLQCIVRIAKSSTSEYLLQVLPEVNIQAKVQVVKNLRRVATESVVAPLAALLEECRLYQGAEKGVLAMEICRTLGASGSPLAFPVLQDILDSRVKQFGKECMAAAELAIAYIQEEGGHKTVLSSLAKAKEPSSSEVIDASSATPASKDAESATMRTAAPAEVIEYTEITEEAEEKEVYALLKKDKKEAAKKVLIRLIEKMAGLKKFNEAEALRLRLIEMDAMALAEIIKAAEIIEEAKSNAIDQDHILIWSELYDLLSTEEFNVFYHALEHESYTAESAIVRQGDRQWRLFFVNKGRVRLYFNEKENETLIKTLGHGNVFGAASFFDDSVWTLSATSMGAVEISTLSADSVEQWAEDFPALEAKLRDYCTRFAQVNDFFMASGAERRHDERHPLAGAVQIALLSDGGEITDTVLHGECSDIASGGISFLSRITQRKQARSLLGRPVSVSFQGDVSGNEKLKCSGIVVAIRNLHAIELGRSVHISFDDELDPVKLRELLNGK